MDDCSTLQPATMVRRAKDVLFSEFDDELLAIDEHAGWCYSLNESAGRVWALIATPAALDTICEHLCREYEVDGPTCLREVSAVVRRLSDAGLVQIGDATVR